MYNIIRKCEKHKGDNMIPNEFIELVKSCKENAVNIIYRSKDENTIKRARAIAINCEQILEKNAEAEREMNEWADNEMTKQEKIADALNGRQGADMTELNAFLEQVADSLYNVYSKMKWQEVSSDTEEGKDFLQFQKEIKELSDKIETYARG